jgi:hypothetical protein
MRAGKCKRHGEKRNVYRVLMGKHESDNLEDQTVDGRIILKWIINKWDRQALQMAVSA